jgi:hypothetical protein
LDGHFRSNEKSARSELGSFVYKSQRYQEEANEAKISHVISMLSIIGTSGLNSTARPSLASLLTSIVNMSGSVDFDAGYSEGSLIPILPSRLGEESTRWFDGNNLFLGLFTKVLAWWYCSDIITYIAFSLYEGTFR